MLLVDNGDTIVLGGIFEQTTRTTVDKVPFLGDIPLLGRHNVANVLAAVAAADAWGVPAPVMRAAIRSGTASSTIAKQPAAWRARASA